MCGLEIYNTLLYTIYSPQIGPKFHLKVKLRKKKKVFYHIFWFTIDAPYFDAPPKLWLPQISRETTPTPAPLVAKFGKRSTKWPLPMDSNGDMWH